MRWILPLTLRMQKAEHYSSLDVGRALAALGVCLYHFTSSDFLGGGLAQRGLRYGYLGVDAFFVISGFVIPIALSRSQYSLKRLPNFLGRRALRLYPPYLAAGLLTLGLWFVSAHAPGFMGSAPHLTSAQLWANLSLSCDFFHQPWIVPVFWTLAIEAQYYIAVGLCFPLFVTESKHWRYIAVMAWLIAPVIITIEPSVFHFGALFAAGILLFLRTAGLIKAPAFVLLASFAFIVQGLTGGWASAIAGGITFVFILVFENRTMWPPWVALGAFSYSIYLVHVPIGGRVINLARRLPPGSPVRYAAVLAAVAVTLGFAYLFYITIEKPSHRLSSKLRMR